MKLKFLGAAKTVTGSFFLIDTETHRFAIDCGLFQGSKAVKERNYQQFPVDPKTIDFLILTHAHIDHSGLIPKLYKHGFRGNIFCTHATYELASVLLPDSAHIQEMEVERKNRKLIRAGKVLLEAIYTMEDAEKCLELFRSLNYDETIELFPGIKIRLRDAGHILGSAIIELWLEENNKTVKVVFSGDLGNGNQPIIKDPAILESADFLVIESTYGNRLHQGNARRAEQLKDVIDYTMKKGGNLIIPAFAVERTQDLIYDLRQLQDEGLLSSDIDIYIDSPLAIAATKIFMKNTDCYDDVTRKMLESEEAHPLVLNNLKFSQTAEESVAVNQLRRNTIIISASGMCDAGRIKHHLKHNLWRPESTILFVGFQAQGTLGRRILEGEKLVNIHGEQVAIKADIKNIDSYSAHADRMGIISWLKKFAVMPKKIFLVHGEEESLDSLAELIKTELNIKTYIPDWLDEVLLDLEEYKDNDMPIISGQEVLKAIEAEKLYLELRLKMHNLFKENWESENYDKIIEELKKIKI